MEPLHLITLDNHHFSTKLKSSKNLEFCGAPLDLSQTTRPITIKLAPIRQRFVDTCIDWLTCSEQGICMLHNRRNSCCTFSQLLPRKGKYIVKLRLGCVPSSFLLARALGGEVRGRGGRGLVSVGRRPTSVMAR